MSLLRPGLCSVTLRHSSPDRVIRLAAAAGLHGVEWGADVHAPPGGELADLAARTRAAGLAVCSYGTYWRATPEDPGHDVLAAARALGCRRLRVWAGTTGSADASTGDRAAVAGRVQQLADLTAEDGLELAFEHHDGTLADTVPSTLDLLAAVDRPNVGTYWQPRVGDPTESALAGLADLLPHVRAVHVFSWWPALERLRLEERSELWTSAIELLASTGRPLDLLLEFLPGDDETLLSGEADRLRTWIAQAGR
ncbi:sugar phosphate isomerase/epimerase family protein [Nitriliruptor alkaliphilus]|uniref:sugar phosphate isomerase/epimerase family protein n=1 Tax=Nitriliruptor alkaliphilus TaxID=427918 RepID=UPI0012EDE1FC|nr:sugar phosphate isomerase/epimerase [Nitriliruptor alkaliphilus]